MNALDPTMVRDDNCTAVMERMIERERRAARDLVLCTMMGRARDGSKSEVMFDEVMFDLKQ